MRWLVLASMIVVAGCRPGPVHFVQYCTEWAAMACDLAERCSCLGDVTYERCPNLMEAQCQDDVVVPVQSGRLIYDEDAARECLDAWRDVLDDCSIVGDEVPEACRRALVGHTPEGQACAADRECQPPLLCHWSVCTRMPGDGEQCFNGMECATGLYCTYDMICQVPRDVGGSCPEERRACREGLYCESLTTTCQQAVGAGASCATNSEMCLEGLYCDFATATCVPSPGGDGDCYASRGACADGLYCEAGARCQPRKPAGETCYDATECLSHNCTDEVCVGLSGVCSSL
jgi:hypothetical protein